MRLEVIGVEGVPEVRADDDLAALLVEACAAMPVDLVDGDVVVVSSKVVSKSLGLWADTSDRSAAVVGQTVRVVAERMAGDRVTRIVQATSGPVMAAAGVDASNTGGVDGLLLLPDDPDAEAARLRERLLVLTGLTRLGVVVSDTAGRPWRVGQTDFALGAAGVQVTDDLRGSVDADGAPLSVTSRAVADELAAAADLVKGKVSHVPAAVVRGSGWAGEVVGAGARRLVRTGREDWFGLGRVEAVRSALGVPPGSPAALEDGIASVAPEAVAERVARAVRVALRGCPDAAVDVGPGHLRVQADSGYQLGVVVSRLRTALWGEGVEVADPPEPSGLEAVLHLPNA